VLLGDTRFRNGWSPGRASNGQPRRDPEERLRAPARCGERVNPPGSLPTWVVAVRRSNAPRSTGYARARYPVRPLPDLYAIVA
jgi:hypothetical protein